MDFLNKSLAQVSELFRSMTPGARITVVLLAGVVVISFGYLFTNQMSGPSSDLMHGVPVTSDQLQAMEAAFGKTKLKSYGQFWQRAARNARRQQPLHQRQGP